VQRYWYVFISLDISMSLFILFEVSFDMCDARAALLEDLYSDVGMSGFFLRMFQVSSDFVRGLF